LDNLSDDLKFYFSVADQLVMERGEYDPIEFLVGAGFLEEEECREWRSGEAGQLQFLLLEDVAATLPVLQQTQTYLLEQGLTKQPLEVGMCPRIGGSEAFAELCCTRLRSVNEQTDLFQDTPLRVAENTIQAALGAHNVGGARKAIDSLRQLHGNASTAHYEQLLAGIEHPDADPLTQIKAIEDVLEPLATRSLGRYAQRYLAELWHAAAHHSRDIRFAPECPHAHASYGYARAGRWADVIASIDADVDWQQHPVLVLRAAEAHAHLGHHEPARRAWSLLCWQHPDIAEVTLPRAPGDPVIARHWREFIGAEPELAVQDFPAWLLIIDVRQRNDVPAMLAPEDEVGVVYTAVLRLVSHPHDMDARALVHQHNPSLLQHYLQRRSAAI
jgi:hypothetical protein